MSSMAHSIPTTPGFAADQLWRHQLRQEHATSMKMIKDIDKQQSLAQQKLEEVEADLSKLKFELEKKKAEDEQQFTELRTQIMVLMASHFPEGNH
jgi:predicted  nucleic acid-binding Zn-ribbon protein